MSQVVRTVLGDVPPKALGLTLGHEHLYARPPADVTDPDLRLDDEAASIAEVLAFKAAGGGAVVEMTTMDYGRDARAMKRISRATGVHVVAATGHNVGKFADRLTAGHSVADLAAWMVSEVRDGIEGTKIRAGLIKASSGLDGPSENEHRVFEAAALAHLETGAPVSTHTEKGTWALGQTDLLLGNEVPAEKVLIGHLDLKPELPYLLEVAATGVYLGLDQFSKEKYLPDRERVRLVAALVEAGRGKQLILGGDLARRSYRVAEGGPGFAHIPRRVAPMLLEAGLSRAQIEDILVHNPRRWLVFEPRSRLV